MELEKDILLGLYRTMLKIRFFEERVIDAYSRGLVPGLAHLYIGEEAITAGVCGVLREDDYITSTHRGHGHVIAKGADLKFMMAGLNGKITGYCKGKGGSMHIADINIGILGANGIAGGRVPIAVRGCLVLKVERHRSGDRRASLETADPTRAPFMKACNLASINKLPVVFICENNLYGISLCQTRHMTRCDIAIRATGYDIPGIIIDGNNVLEVYGAAQKAVQKGEGGRGAQPDRMQDIPVAGASRG